MKKHEIIIIILLCIVIFLMGRTSREAEIQHLKHTINTFPHSDYQLNTDNSGYSVFDGNNCIGIFQWDESRTLDSIIIKDNL